MQAFCDTGPFTRRRRLVPTSVVCSSAIVLPVDPVEVEFPLGDKVEGLAESDHGDWLLFAGAMVRKSVMDV